ncbi:MAG TPA: MFS transporter [Candidatus Thermoplasmatota archaeon]|nr:MFS transporter [Candidatus Thermoplasmatota archaeon]
MRSDGEKKITGLKNPQTRRYILYLVIFMGMIALMDQYLSFIETTAIPNILREYSVTDAQYSWWKALYFIPTFLIVLLNGLTDIIGRKKSLLILILLFGLASLGIVYATPSFHLYMLFFAIITFATVSNMWAIPISEEAPAEKRAKYLSIIYFMSLIPLQAIIPPLLARAGLSWKWMYGIMFLFMIPVLVMWFFMKETKRYETIKEERRLGKRKKHFYGIGVINRCDLKYIIFSGIIWMCWLIVSMFVVWAGHYFMDIHGYTLDQWSITLLGSLLMMMAGAIIGGWTMDKMGRKTGLIIGCAGLGLFVVLIGLTPVPIARFMAMITGFFLGFSYTWIIVYIPEIFPTERRGSCMGWTTTTARVSYVLGPALAGIMLTVSPSMVLFWVLGGLLMIVPIVLVFLFHPYETKLKELEEIEEKRQSSS